MRFPKKFKKNNIVEINSLENCIIEPALKGKKVKEDILKLHAKKQNQLKVCPLMIFLIKSYNKGSTSQNEFKQLLIKNWNLIKRQYIIEGVIMEHVCEPDNWPVPVTDLNKMEFQGIVIFKVR